MNGRSQASAQLDNDSGHLNQVAEAPWNQCMTPLKKRTSLQSPAISVGGEGDRCLCNRYVTSVVLQAPSEVSGTTVLQWVQTYQLWLPKRHHYQLRQRKASYPMMQVAHYIPEE